jgi:hypothetical protein
MPALLIARALKSQPASLDEGAESQSRFSDSLTITVNNGTSHLEGFSARLFPKPAQTQSLVPAGLFALYECPDIGGVAVQYRHRWDLAKAIRYFGRL